MAYVLHKFLFGINMKIKLLLSPQKVADGYHHTYFYTIEEYPTMLFETKVAAENFVEAFEMLQTRAAQNSTARLIFENLTNRLKSRWLTIAGVEGELPHGYGGFFCRFRDKGGLIKLPELTMPMKSLGLSESNFIRLTHEGSHNLIDAIRGFTDPAMNKLERQLIVKAWEQDANKFKLWLKQSGKALSTLPADELSVVKDLFYGIQENYHAPAMEGLLEKYGCKSETEFVKTYIQPANRHGWNGRMRPMVDYQKVYLGTRNEIAAFTLQHDVCHREALLRLAPRERDVISAMLAKRPKIFLDDQRFLGNRPLCDLNKFGLSDRRLFYRNSTVPIWSLPKSNTGPICDVARYKAPRFKTPFRIAASLGIPILHGVSGYFDYKHYRENLPNSSVLEALEYAVLRETVFAGFCYGASVVLGGPMGLPAGTFFTIIMMPEPSFDPVLNRRCVEKLLEIPVEIPKNALQLTPDLQSQLGLSICNQAKAINRDTLGTRRSLWEVMRDRGREIRDSIITDPNQYRPIAANTVTNPPKHPNPARPLEVSSADTQAYLERLKAHSEQITEQTLYRQRFTFDFPIVTADSLLDNVTPQGFSSEDQKNPAKPREIPSLRDEPLPDPSSHMSNEAELALGIEQVLNAHAAPNGLPQDDRSSVAVLEKAGIRVLKSEWGTTAFLLDEFSTANLSPELQLILETSGMDVGKEPGSQVRLESSRSGAVSTPFTNANNKDALIKDLKFVATQDGAVVGIQGKIGNNDGTISIVGKIGGSGGIVCVTINVGLTLATFGIAAGVLALLIATQSLINGHIRRINRKINRHLERSDKDAQFISSNLSAIVKQLNAESGTELKGILAKTNSLIRHISEKIHLEKKRAKEARKLKKPEAANQHNAQARSYQQTFDDISAPKDALKIQELSHQFIEKNKEKTASDLITLAEQFSKKTSYTVNDVGQVQGLRRLIISKAQRLIMNGKTQEAQALFKAGKQIHYYQPDAINTFSFGAGMGVLDKRTQGDLSKISTNISQINKKIASGEEPYALLEGLLEHIETAEDVLANLRIRKSKPYRHRIARTSDKYVSGQQWKARIEAFIEYVAYLKLQLKAYKNGNQEIDLDLDGVSATFQALFQHADEPVDYWLQKLEENKGDREGVSAEQILYENEFAKHHVLSDVLKKAGERNFDAAKETLQQFGEKGGAATGFSEKLFGDMSSKGEGGFDASIDALAQANLSTKINDQQEKLDGLSQQAANKFASATSSYGARVDQVIKLGLTTLSKEHILNQLAHGEQMTFKDGNGLKITLGIKNNRNWSLVGEITQAQQALNTLKQGNANAIGVPAEEIAFAVSLLDQLVKDDIFSAVRDCNFEDAKTKLQQYAETGNKERGVATGYLAGLEVGLTNQDQNYLFYLDVLKNHQNNFNPSEKTTMENAVAASVVGQKANERSDLGYYREAANIFDKLASSVAPELHEGYDASANLQRFTYHGQLLGAAVRPLQSILACHVHAMKKSTTKTGAERVLFVLNTAQILLPNAVPLALQGVCHYGFGKSATFNRSVRMQLKELITDPFNVAMIVVQISLMAVHHLPIEWAFEGLGLKLF